MPWDVHDDNKDAKVKVTEGVHKDTGQEITRIIVADKAANEHHDLGFDKTTGEQVFHTTRSND